MKYLIYILLPLLFLILSCEEVIDVELNESPPKLVIEGSVSLLDDGSSVAFIKLSTTTSFYDTQFPIVSNAQVTITDDAGREYPFIHSQNGFFQGEFIPEFNELYTLEIIYKDEIYISQQRLEPVVPLEYVEQNNEGGFGGDEIELKVFFKDPGGERNFYFFEGLSSRGNYYDVLTDEFFDGNYIFGFFTMDDLQAGDEVVFNLNGINEQTYNYIFTLLRQTGSSAGPFETQPATVRGNIINTTRPENFPLGYFRISQVSNLMYTVQ